MLNINKSSNTGLTQTEGMNNASQTEIGKISPHQDTTKNKKENNLKKTNSLTFSIHLNLALKKQIIPPKKYKTK
ncbi:hypothetical protein EBME_0829 [bacterium endosymbiont of Mortierella elongata FMR23-6]|nr:hypothetical protein EBME_0829 [bacterium endosymbiont of Mortierella elongata FMR23-6]